MYVKNRETEKINKMSINSEIIFFFNENFHRLLSEIEQNVNRLFGAESLAGTEDHSKNPVRK